MVEGKNSQELSADCHTSHSTHINTHRRWLQNSNGRVVQRLRVLTDGDPQSQIHQPKHTWGLDLASLSLMYIGDVVWFSWESPNNWSGDWPSVACLWILLPQVARFVWPQWEMCLVSPANDLRCQSGLISVVVGWWRGSPFLEKGRGNELYEGGTGGRGGAVMGM